MLFDGLDIYLVCQGILESVLKLTKCHFSLLLTILNCQAEYPLKTISVSESSMSGSSNSIARFLNFALKVMKSKV